MCTRLLRYIALTKSNILKACDRRNGLGDPGRGLTAQRYLNEMLKPVVVSFIRRNRRTVLQHDNARPHVPRITRGAVHNADVYILQNWPALSPDLNPIEHCCLYLKRMSLIIVDAIRRV